MSPDELRRDRLFTSRFLLMWGYNFTVFVSVFQLLPTAPFYILSLGGSQAAAGLFLGLLTYASAVSAPLTGALGDRYGKRRMLLVASVAITIFSLLYAIAPSYQIILVLVLIHGIFWSGLLSSSSSYIIDIVPPSRRAEGLGYSGFASILAIAVAPSLGLWVFDRGGWLVMCLELAMLNMIMAVIAWRLPPDRRHAQPSRALSPGDLIEWRVLIGAITLFLYSFSYGGITSFVAVYAEQVGVTPRALYFSVFSVAILATRPFMGRYADRIGHARLIVPCLAMIVVGIGILSIATDRTLFVVSALLFGVGFGSAYPIFVAHLMQHVPEHRRTATFGALIGAFDTGIGTGSIAVGWLSQRYGFGRAFGVAGALALLSIPYFLYLEKRQWTTSGSARQA
ncbi:MAG TPA: MFS transporter [Vicinamibacterales bacterium]|nr:MFS transporter [Vicinamibacterales bacterium]